MKLRDAVPVLALAMLTSCAHLRPPEMSPCSDRQTVEQLLRDSREDESANPWLRVSYAVDEPVYVGEPVLLRVRLTDIAANRGLPDADVRAEVRMPGRVLGPILDDSGAEEARECVILRLTDDDAGGDEQAKDGEYTAVFRSTDVSGEYTFIFAVHGAHPSGSAFIRAHVIDGLFAGVRPDTTGSPPE